MGLIDTAMGALFGQGGNVIRDTAEVFRVNAEAQAAREAEARAQALQQFAAEFAGARRSWFDAVIDGVNRLPRPAMALGTLALFGAAMADPDWFGARMAGLAQVPEPLWWLLGAVVSFYFGARHQAKGHVLQRQIAATLAAGSARWSPRDTHGGPEAEAATPPTGDNPALAAWRHSRGSRDPSSAS